MSATITKTSEITQAESARAAAEREAADAAQRAEQAQARLALIVAKREGERKAELLAWARRIIAAYPREKAALQQRATEADSLFVNAVRVGDFAAILDAHLVCHAIAVEIFEGELRALRALALLPVEDRHAVNKGLGIRDRSFSSESLDAALSRAIALLKSERYAVVAEAVHAEQEAIEEAE